ncbi:MAG TPA: hypothetical protein PLO51_02615 [Candidatus Micrarchaeota archaeon]|nr:hypothetical protein [Candidatus Micrarchaeota archaeon]
MNLKLEGLTEEIINELVSRKIASNKTEAIRMAILHYNEHYDIKPIKKYIEEEAWQSASEKSLEKIWNNKKDDKAWNKY